MKSNGLNLLTIADHGSWCEPNPCLRRRPFSEPRFSLACRACRHVQNSSSDGLRWEKRKHKRRPAGRFGKIAAAVAPLLHQRHKCWDRLIVTIGGTITGASFKGRKIKLPDSLSVCRNMAHNVWPTEHPPRLAAQWSNHRPVFHSAATTDRDPPDGPAQKWR